MAGFSSLSALDAQLDSLSARDRKLFMGLLVGLALFVVGLSSWWLRTSLDSAASDVIAAKQDLQVAYALQEEYLRADAEVKKQEERLRAAPPQSLRTYVEALASKHGVGKELRGVTKEGSTENNGITVTTYQVEFRMVSLEPLLKVLKDMEMSQYPLKVEDAAFTTKLFKQEQTIDLTLEVLVYSLSGA